MMLLTTGTTTSTEAETPGHAGSARRRRALAIGAATLLLLVGTLAEAKRPRAARRHPRPAAAVLVATGVVAPLHASPARAQIAAPLPALAERSSVPAETSLARFYFQRGLAFYQANDYPRALSEFEVARRFRPAPAFDYNIGRCHDRMEHVPEAIHAYQRYLKENLAPAEAAEVRARIEILRARLSHKAIAEDGRSSS